MEVWLQVPEGEKVWSEEIADSTNDLQDTGNEAEETEAFSSAEEETAEESAFEKSANEDSEQPMEEAAEENGPVFCVNCGAELTADALFCPKCGKKVEAAGDETRNKIDQYNAKVSKKIQTKKMLPVYIAAAAIVIILIVVLATRGGGKNFNRMYADIAGESWCTIASDGSYMKIDTNPLNIDDYSNYSAYLKLAEINKDLGFSAAVFDDMGSTRAMDGKQTAESSKATVSWRYHPDQGLEVTYSWK